MSRKILKLEYDYDFVLMGIIAQLKDYRLCYEVNKVLELDLKKENDMEITLSKTKEISYFSFYRLEDEENYRIFYLLANKGNKGFLLPEKKNIDYLFMIKGTMQENETKEILTSLRGVQAILGVYPILPVELKSKENLLFE